MKKFPVHCFQLDEYNLLLNITVELYGGLVFEEDSFPVVTIAHLTVYIFVADLVFKLLNKNVDVNYEDKEGRSPFWYAVVASKLVNNYTGRDYDIPFDDLPKHFAMIKHFLLRGANPLIRDTCLAPTDAYILDFSLFPILLAVKMGYMTLETVILNSVKQIIDSCSENGILNYIYRNNLLCILISAQFNCFEQFKILFSLMNKIKLTPCPDDPALPNLDLMFRAAKLGDINVVKYLQQEHKVSVRVVDEGTGCNTLDGAIKYGKKEVVSYLLSLGVRPHKMCLAEMAKLHVLRAKIVDEVTAGTKTPISLFTLSKLSLFERYNITELNKIFPKTYVNQIKK